MSEVPEGYPTPDTNAAAGAPEQPHEEHVHAPAETEAKEGPVPPVPAPPQRDRMVLRVEPSVARVFRDFFTALTDGKEIIVVEQGRE